jgi:hypothetical protein
MFHPLHVIHIDAAAELSRATKLMVGAPSLANVGKTMISLATSFPGTPGAFAKSLYFNPKAGYSILKAFQGRLDMSKLSETDKAAFKDLAEGGLVPTRPQQETSGVVRQWKDAIIKRSAGAVFHLPWVGLDYATGWMYNTWIPSLKIASYLKDVKVARELNPNWAPAQRQEAFRQIARKVEARYGEMNYNTMFMNKMYKDIGVATTLSLGWQLGLLDQYVGGAIDLGKALVGKGTVKEKVAQGIYDRPVFAAYYISSALMIGGLMTKWLGGQDPQELIDYTHPLSGEMDEFGKPIRLNTMFYTREFEGLYKHIQQEGPVEGVSNFVTSKGSGMMAEIRAALTGIDSLGNEIYKPSDPVYMRVEEALNYEYSDLKPIVIQALEKGSGQKMAALSIAGFTPAGAYISQTVTEGKISAAYKMYGKPSVKPFDAVQMGKDMKELRKFYNSDDEHYDDKLEAMIGKYDLSPKEVRGIQKRFASPKGQDFDPSVFQFGRLPWEAQKPLLDGMKDEEKEKYLNALGKQKKQKYLRETEDVGQ